MRVFAALLMAVCGAAAGAGQTSTGNGRLSGELHVPAVARQPFLGVLTRTVERPGNARMQHTETRVARDSAGRVYEEQRTPQIAGTRVESVQISFTVQDPVAKVLRTCRPQVMECTEIAMSERMLARLTALEVPGKEDLGAEAIGGLAVTHTREQGRRPSTPSPADSAGAETPVTVSREVWFSAELETPLRVMFEDEQRGKQLTELTVMNRKEPESAMFAMPQGYKLVDPPAPLPVQPLPPGVERIGNGVSAPVVLFAPEPEFSEEARKAKFAGNVMVSMIVDETGRAIEVKVLRGVGKGLDEKAVEAVSKYRFRPAMKAGQPVKVQMDVEVNFQRF